MFTFVGLNVAYVKPHSVAKCIVTSAIQIKWNWIGLNHITIHFFLVSESIGTRQVPGVSSESGASYKINRFKIRSREYLPSVSAVKTGFVLEKGRPAWRPESCLSERSNLFRGILSNVLKQLLCRNLKCPNKKETTGVVSNRHWTGHSKKRQTKQ